MDPQAQPQNVPMQPAMESSSNGQKKIGPVIAILVIVLILILAALYIFASRSTTAPETSALSQESQSVQPVTNSSDDINSIQADLNASTNGLDNQNF